MKYTEDILNVTKLKLPWDKLSNCNILVTGATGLIGNCFVETLMERSQRDYSVYAMGRNTQRMNILFNKYMNTDSFHTIIGDVTEPLSLDCPFHYIIHAASGAAPIEFAQHPVEVMMANISGVRNLIEYGIRHEMKRLLYISSGEIYGEGDGRVFTEEYSGYVDCLNPRSCYPSSKRAAETLCVSYAAEYNLDVVIARPCHVYGPYYTEGDNRVYAQFIRNVLQGEDIIMKSTGCQFRSWCYVVDCVSALLHILLKGENCQAYNIADISSNISIKELAEMIAGIEGKRVETVLPDNDEKRGFNVVTRSIISTKKIEFLGWRVQGTMSDKILSTINERKRYEEIGVDFRR